MDTLVSTAKIQQGKYQNTKIDRWPFVQHANQMKQEGIQWKPAWKDLSKYINPTRGFFDEIKPNDGKTIDHKTVIDSTAEDSMNTLSSGMVSGLTSPSRPWFRLALQDPDLMQIGNVKYWLDDVNNRMLDVFAKSNVYGGLSSVYEEVATFGTSCSFLEEDMDDVIRMRVYTCGEYYLTAGPDGRINGFYRIFWMTVAQLVKEFGIENCTQATQTAYQNDQTETWVKVNFLIEVNDNRVKQYIDYRNMAYRRDRKSVV